MSFNLPECPNCKNPNPPIEKVKEYKNNFKACTCSRCETYRVVYFEKSTYRNLYNKVIEKMKKIWRHPLEWRYTDHSTFHSSRIIKWGEDLMAPLKGTDDRLQAEEMLLFVLAAYLHDAAMQRIGEEAREEIERIKEINKEQWEEEQKKASGKDGEKEKDRLDRLTELYENIRKKHAERAPEVVVEIMKEIMGEDEELGNLIGSLCEPLKYICRFHSGKKDELQDCKLEEDIYSIGNTIIKALRIKMLAGILRFADELDLERTRVSNLFPMKHLPLGAYSCLHWIKHVLVKEAYIDDHRIIIKFSHPELSGDTKERKAEEYFYQQIAFWVKSKLLLEWEFIRKEMDMIRKGSNNLVNPILPSPGSYMDNIKENPFTPSFKAFEDKEKKKKIQEALENEIKKVTEKLRKIYEMPKAPEKMDEKELEEKVLEMKEESTEIKIEFDPIELMKMFGISMFMSGKLDEAEKILSVVHKNREKDLEAIGTLGNICYEKKEYQKAIEYYEKALEIKPDKHEALNNMGVAYRNMGNHEKAIESYKKALEIKPDKHEALYNMGNTYDDLGNHEKAIESYKKALEIKPDKDEALNNMGVAYGNMADYKKAIECYEKALEIKPDKDEALNNMGVAYGNMADYKKAIECYEKALEIKPDKHEALNNMGNAYGNLDNHEKAIQCYEKALEIKPDKHEALYNMGNAYGNMGNHEKAIECFEKALEIKPDSHEALNNMGSAYGNLDKHKKAIECYEKALEIKPDKHEALYNMGNAYGNMGNHEKAIECFEKALEIKPDSHEALYNMGVAYRNMGNHEKAIKCYEKALEIKPDSHEILSNIGTAYRDLGKHEKAIKYFKKALKNKPDYYGALESMGVTYNKMGKYEKALECHSKALEIKPDFPGSLYNLACIHSLKYAKSIKSDPSNPSKEDLKNAFDYLKKAIEGDEEYRKMADDDKDFDSIWDMPQFKKLTGN